MSRATMANRINSSSSWTQDITKQSHRSKKPRSSKRQLGSTSVEWITPLKCHKSRASTTSQSVPKAASAHAIRCIHSSKRPSTTQFSSRPNSSRQSQRIASSSNISQVGLSGLSKPLKLAPRPSSSQTTSSKWSTTRSTTANGITPPQGFDLASYVKQTGTAQGIIIGKNGQPTSDSYFDAYLSQCEDELAKESIFSEYEANSFVDLSEESEMNERNHQGQTPLCWEEQLALSECLRCVTPNLSENSLRASKLKLKESLRVKLVLNEQCLLERTYVKFLQDIAELPATKTTVMTTEGKSSFQQQTHVLQILLYSSTIQLHQQLLNQSFEVCVTEHSSPESMCVFKGLTPRRVLSCVSVITVHLEMPQTLFSTEVESFRLQLCSVTVWFEQQRSLLFSAHLQPCSGYPPTPPPRDEGDGFIDQVQRQLISSKETEKPSYDGPPEVPEKFFHKRASYYNQDEDEDRTDISVISNYLPELKLIENDVSQSPCTTSQSSRPTTTQHTTQHEASSSVRPSSLSLNCSNTFNYSSRGKTTQRVIVVPSVSENVSRHQSTIELRKSWNGLLSDKKRLHRKASDNSNTFSVIANNWIGRYF